MSAQFFLANSSIALSKAVESSVELLKNGGASFEGGDWR